MVNIEITVSKGKGEAQRFASGTFAYPVDLEDAIQHFGAHEVYAVFTKALKVKHEAKLRNKLTETDKTPRKDGILDRIANAG